MCDKDEYVFDYLLKSSGFRRTWRFKNNPRDKELEDRIIKLGKREIAFEQEQEDKISKIADDKAREEAWYNFYRRKLPCTKAIWNHLGIASYSNELIGLNLLFISEASEEIEPQPLREFKLGQCFLHKSNWAYINQYAYFFSLDGSITRGGVLYRLIKNNKIIIPFCIPKIGGILPFWPVNYTRSLFNAQFISQAKVIIITDDIAIAASAQRDLQCNCLAPDIAWLSWYGEPSEYKWDVLKDKTIYFYVETHSGLTLEKILEKAESLQEELKKVNGSDLKLIFMHPSRIPRYYSNPSDDLLPLIISWKEWKDLQISKSKPLYDGFEAFLHKLSPRAPKRASFDIQPFIPSKCRILIHGAGDGKRLWLLSLLYSFCMKLPLFYKEWTPSGGIALYLHPDKIDLSDWLSLLTARGSGFYPDKTDPIFNVVMKQIDQPRFIYVPLNLSALKPHEGSDIIELIDYIDKGTHSILSSLPKILIFDSFGSLLQKETGIWQQVIENLQQNGWTIIWVESRRGRLKKLLSFDQEIQIEPVPTFNGCDVICTTNVFGGHRINKLYRINFQDIASLPLYETPCERKSQGLCMKREILIQELKKLFEKGFTGKNIASKLQISESLVKKLKRELGLSRTRPKISSIIPYNL